MVRKDFFIHSKDLYRLLTELGIMIPGIKYSDLVYKRVKFRSMTVLKLIPSYEKRMVVLVNIEEHFDICLSEEDIKIEDILIAIDEEHNI